MRLADGFESHFFTRTAFRAVIHITALVEAIMVAPDTAPIDLIGEFQLRHWARVNYIPADMRGSDLHPVVLDEMRRRDKELSEGELASHYSQHSLPND